MALGSDSHAVIDLFEEARALELDERLRSRERGVHAAGDLLAMATRTAIAVSAGTMPARSRSEIAADLVTVSLDSVRTAGTDRRLAVEATVFAATSGDVTDVFVDGRQIVSNRRHHSRSTSSPNSMHRSRS